MSVSDSMPSAIKAQELPIIPEKIFTAAKKKLIIIPIRVVFTPFLAEFEDDLFKINSDF